MSLNQFMTENLDIIKDEIIKNIPNPEFDSHEFIRLFAKRFEINYIDFLSSYKNEPFRNVHAQIGRFLWINLKCCGDLIIMHRYSLIGTRKKRCLLRLFVYTEMLLF